MPTETVESELNRVAPEDTATNRARPFLKWAGGKRQLLPQIRRFYPETFKNYVEPFVGSGAVFFDLYNRGLLRSRHTTLIDSNADLISCYLNVRDHTVEVVKSLSRLATAHKRDPEQHFYRVRNKRFNPERARIARDSLHGDLNHPGYVEGNQRCANDPTELRHRHALGEFLELVLGQDHCGLTTTGWPCPCSQVL